MVISIKKFGPVLTARYLGKEALAAFLPKLYDVPQEEKIYVDFDGVGVFSPAWGDEFLTGLHRIFLQRLILKKSDHASVRASIEMLEETNNIKFIIE